jgi:hypothetical protein
MERHHPPTPPRTPVAAGPARVALPTLDPLFD